MHKSFCLIVALISTAAAVPSTYAASTLAACANRTNGNLRVVSAPDDCRQNEDFVILNTGGSAKATAQNTWYTSTSGIFGAWFPVSGSTFTATTNGGPLLIFIDVSLNGGSHATCRPVIDGVWAGTYGGLSKSPSDPFWTEGLVGVGAIGSGWQKWSKTRLYPGVPAGIHTFGVECATDGGTLTVGTTSVGASAGFVEQ